MENMSTEVLDLICDTHKNDKDLLSTILYYIYKTSTDNKMLNQIESIFNNMNYCLECGGKTVLYEYKETHNEVDYPNVETLYCRWCPICDKYEIPPNVKEVIE